MPVPRLRGVLAAASRFASTEESARGCGGIAGGQGGEGLVQRDGTTSKKGGRGGDVTETLAILRRSINETGGGGGGRWRGPLAVRERSWSRRGARTEAKGTNNQEKGTKRERDEGTKQKIN